MLKNDRFIQTMLYGSLFYGSNMKDMPTNGFKLYEDGTMSYVTRNGETREIEVSEDHPGKLNVKVIDVRSNELLQTFAMTYVNQECTGCKNNTIHALKEKRYYCTECGTFSS